MSGEYDVFVGPCSHGRDPWDRCEICGEGTAIEAAVELIEKLQQEIVILKNPRVADKDFSVLADLWQKQAERAERERDELQIELTAACDLSQRQATLLEGVVNALRGPPPDNMLWSHHDAPQLALQVSNEIKNLRKALKIVVNDYENGLLCCESNGNTEEVVRICREALAGKEVTGL